MTTLLEAALASGASDHHSQFHEAAVLTLILDQIGVEDHVGVEFGAGDGLSCSNTAHLWRDQGWRCLLVEPDADRYEALEGNAGPFDTILRRAFIKPTGPLSIGTLLEDHGLDSVDYMSIDVDGDDYFILRALTCRPRVISIEFNPTIPPHLDVRQARPGAALGSSLLSIVRLGERLGYRFVGATYCNAFLVDEPLAGPFLSYEADPLRLFPPSSYTYAITDFAGRVVLVGEPMPWGPTVPFIQPLEAATTVTQVTDNPQHLRRGFEDVWGAALLLPANVVTSDNLGGYLAGGQQLICVDFTNTPDFTPAYCDWIARAARTAGYTPMLNGRILGLIKRGTQ